MKPHPSRKLVESAELAVTADPGAAAANQRYFALGREFRPAALTATSGLRGLLAEIESATGLQPPRPDTLRGRLGQTVIGLQSRALWWLIRALRLRDKALRVTEGVLTEMATELNRLRDRVEVLERQAREREECDRRP